MAMLPPSPFSMRTIFQRVGLAVPLVTSAMAFIFSTAWDNIIASQGVWTFDKLCMKGTLFSIPYEEYAWFILHTVLAQFILLRIWSVSAQLQRRPDFLPRCHDVKILVPVCMCLVAAAAGFLFLREHSTLYLGVLLAFMGPVLAFQWATFGHFVIWKWQPPLFAIVAQSAYVLVVDQYAISRHIWHIYDGCGIRFPIYLFGNPGMQLEQVLVYSLTTVMVVLTLHPFLLITEAFYNTGQTGSWVTFAQKMVKSDGNIGIPGDSANGLVHMSTSTKRMVIV